MFKSPVPHDQAKIPLEERASIPGIATTEADMKLVSGCPAPCSLTLANLSFASICETHIEQLSRAVLSSNGFLHVGVWICLSLVV